MSTSSINGNHHATGKLYAGMTKESIRADINAMTFKSAQEREEAYNKQIKLFDYANSLVEGEVDNVISEREIEAYNKKEKTKKTWKAIGLIAAGVGVAVAGFLIAGKIKSSMLSKAFTKENCNITRLPDDDVSEILKKTIGNKKYRIATSGYSQGMEGYDEPTREFLKSMDKALGSRNTAYIMPPALEKGSIYDITAEVSGLGKDKALFVTAERYYDNYLNLEHFADNVNKSKYMKTPMLVFPTPEVYTSATANASNVLVCTGGRKVAVTEIVEALKRKNRVIILDNLCLKNGTYNMAKGEVENAAKYFEDMLILNRGSYPVSERLQLEELLKHPGRINSLVRVYPVDNGFMSAKDAGIRAANSLKNKTLYDFFPEEIVERAW